MAKTLDISSGFFNSSNGDRKYYATDFSKMFDGIITDGVFPTVGDAFKVTSDETGMQVRVGVGRAWFNGYWARTDTVTVLDIDAAPTAVNYERIDAIALHVSMSNRKSTIEVITGTAGTNPIAATLTSTDDDKYYRLANVRVKYGVTKIANADISITVGATGTDYAPFVKGVTTTVDNLIALWNQQFNNWFDNMKDQLDTDAAGHLQNEIDGLKSGYVKKTGESHQEIEGLVTFANRIFLQKGTDIEGSITIDSVSYGPDLPTKGLYDGLIFFKEADS